MRPLASSLPSRHPDGLVSPHHPPAIQYQFQPIEYQIDTYSSLGNLLCPLCHVPMVLRCRMSPCYHLACETCVARSQQNSQRPCPRCQQPYSEIGIFSFKDALYTCPEEDCHQVFLDLPSMRYHHFMIHQFLPHHDDDKMIHPQEVTPVYCEPDFQSLFRPSQQNPPLQSSETSISQPIISQSHPVSQVKSVFRPDSVSLPSDPTPQQTLQSALSEVMVTEDLDDLM